MKTTGFLRTGPLLALLILSSTGAQAGPSDTPLPLFSDLKPALHVYTAVGVIKNNDLETVFVCTNLHTDKVNVGVEVFTKQGILANTIGDPNGEIIDLEVGETWTVGTSGTAQLSEDVTINALPSLNSGSGRIVATSKNISCIALLVDEVHVIVDPQIDPVPPPPIIVNLPLIRLP